MVQSNTMQTKPCTKAIWQKIFFNFEQYKYCQRKSIGSSKIRHMPHVHIQWMSNICFKKLYVFESSGTVKSIT